MSGKRKSLEQMVAEDAPTTEEQLAFADQMIALDDELRAQADHNEKRLGERVRTLRETAPQVTGRRGGKAKRKKHKWRMEIEGFMEEELFRGVKPESVLDRAVEEFERSRDNLKKNYLRPLLKRIGLALKPQR